MLSSLGISRILAESQENILGAAVTSIEYYRKERAVQIYLNRERLLPDAVVSSDGMGISRREEPH
jgi:hypothetical protein